MLDPMPRQDIKTPPTLPEARLLTRIEELEAKLAKAVEALVEAVIVPEAWMISGFPDMPSEAKEQIVESVIKARATIAKLTGDKQ